MTTDDDLEEQRTPPPSLFPRWSDGGSRPPQSQWLHSTLAELDEKIQTILDLIEDNGDTFAKRVEMYYKKRPRLIKKVQELHGSYRALAEKYDQLRIKSRASVNPSSLSDSFKEGETPRINEDIVREFSAPATRENDWINKQMKFSDLLEESLSKQAELIRRNDEKREINMARSRKDGIKGKDRGKGVIVEEGFVLL